MPLRDSLDHHFRGAIRDLEVCRSAPVPAADDLELRAMAASALNYLRGNPDPARNYECKFSLGPLGIPAQVPLLASNKYGFDPIALGDTDCRMDWQYAHMREMAGEPQPEAVERGVRQRVLSYLRADHLAWMNPAAWVGTIKSPSAQEAIKHEWAFTWANAYLIGRAVQPGERLTLRWSVPRFQQVFVAQSVPGREQSVTVEWLGNTVQRVSPKGQYLPMFAAIQGE